MNAPVSPTKLARDIDILARRGRVLDILLSGEDVTVAQLAMELEMPPVNIRYVLADLVENPPGSYTLRCDFNGEVETWWLG